MNDMGQTELDIHPNVVENLAKKYATETLLQPAEGFSKYVNSLMPLEATDFERIGVVQEAATRYNAEASDPRKISLLFHFTDHEGAADIGQSGRLGKAAGGRVYLTPITPEMASPLSSAEDAKGYEKYFRDKIMPHDLHEHIERFILGLKFKWQYEVLKKIKGKFGNPIIPVGSHKLENVVIIASGANNPIFKRDEHGEIYLEKPLKMEAGPECATFGPYKTAAPNPVSKST